MNKKIITGAVILAVLIILSLGYYFFFVGKSAVSVPNNSNGSPFGTPGNSTVVSPAQNTAQQTIVGGVATTVEQKQNGLRQLSTVPVSDGSFMNPATSTASTSAPIVRFIERATGHVYEADLGSGSINRISNTTIPKIEQVAWGVPGTTLLTQFIDQNSIKDTVVKIGPMGTTTATTSLSDENVGLLPVSQSQFPDNIISAAFSPKGDTLFYLTKGVNGVEGYLSLATGETPTLLWQFPTTEWLVQWPTNSTTTVFMTSNASNNVPGVLFSLDTKSQKTSVVISGVSGLTTNVSPSGNKVLYTDMEGSIWHMYVYDQKYKTRIPLSFATFPEKCVWTKNELTIYCARPQAVSANAPDDWYQGTVSYDDSLWKFDFTSGEATEVSPLSPDSGQTLDFENPHLSPHGDYIAFTNKKDLTFWAVPTSQ